jgi:hypothetical protein
MERNLEACAQTVSNNIIDRFETVFTHSGVGAAQLCGGLRFERFQRVHAKNGSRSNFTRVQHNYPTRVCALRWAVH